MSTTQLNVVLADDDEDDRMLFVEAIDEISIKTELSLFNHGQELMDYLTLPNALMPNLIFLDLNMPIKNGLQCLKEIRENPKLKDLCVAIYSTSSSEKDIEETFLNGANIYVNKPHSFSKLRDVVEKVLQLNWQYHTSNLNKDTFLFRI
ncbi:response regulator [Jejuia pallidilutea]|jgi:CheY-like chemotaxis protein|uniref:Response regulator receiver domain-containing protein n=1 Tax=Jejuia pallidilutea TaxID=504487 RepID=A0A090VXA5_9FLAO|nr:response regulator [Jejuia pallidilutea]PQV49028.1 response regulator receiver domain-containing protein [Jejuia pallidilutea]GAL68573.1 two-component response regulator [Jejuia pallidilutea]GAL72770.1 two-component response regulator [Jejuia pallidilutea]GAL90164.1 two-component response regulator CheY subfamily [Jejuia pallidilutea]